MGGDICGQLEGGLTGPTRGAAHWTALGGRLALWWGMSAREEKQLWLGQSKKAQEEHLHPKRFQVTWARSGGTQTH